jgi:hypothetical protein
MTSHLPRLAAAVSSVCALVGDEDAPPPLALHSQDGRNGVGEAVPNIVTASEAVIVTTEEPHMVAVAEAPQSAASDLGWSLVDSVHQLSDAQLQSLLSSAGSGRAEFDRIISVAAGEVAKRSRRELGHSGLAQSKGHRSAVQLVQVLTGESPSEARRQIRVGELLGEAAGAETPGTETPGRDSTRTSTSTECGAESREVPWQHPVTTAINTGALSPEIAHLIIRTLEDVSATCPDHVRRQAAAELVEYATAMRGRAETESGGVGILRDDVHRRARQVRDRIDVDGVEDRFNRRYEKRSLKTWRDTDGALNFHGIADDEAGVFLTQMFDLALSPRRGGPRFTSKDDTSWADAMLDDPRTNQQLMFDTFMQVVRMGAACDEKTVFRAERPGVRVVTVVDAVVDAEAGEVASGLTTGVLEGSDDAVPATFVGATACDRGTVPITVDRDGRALNLGRTQRTFSPAQRVVLRARDGGCLWPGCDRPAWQTEAHHINEWDADHGRTDVADGVLLCRFHHLNLHARHWRIRRRGTEYELVPPPPTGLNHAALIDAGSNHTGPRHTAPGHAEPGHTEPGHAEPSKAEPNHAGPDRAVIPLRSKTPTWERRDARSA